MNWLFAIVGGVIGAAVADGWGAVSGAGLGYLLGISAKLSEKLERLERKVRALESEQTRAAEKITEQVSNKARMNSPLKPAPLKSTAQAVRQSIEPDITPVNDGIILDLDLPEEDHITVKHSAKPSEAQGFTAGAAKVREVTPLDRGIDWLKRYFTEGNVIVRVGLVVLFFGLSFLVKYSIDNALLPIELRVSAIACAAVSMLIFGWKKRLVKAEFGLALQGGGIAILYLVTFASYSLYHLIPAVLTFPLLVVFSVLGMALAIMQNAKALAISAILGGFASPILASSGGGSHVGLFSYYLVLNLAIFGVAWFKSWRLLNVVGFAFTFLVGAIWGVTQYSPENFASTEPFLIIFFLLYVSISLLFATKQLAMLKGIVDGTLVFGVPLVGFGLQAALVQDYNYGLAWSALALGLFYMTVIVIIRNTRQQHLQVLTEAMLALGVIFLSLTIPFTLDSQLTAATWAIEGAGFVWLGLKQKRKMVKYFGVLLQGLGAVLFLADMPYTHNGLLFLNTEYLGIFIVSVAAMLSAYLFDTNENGNKEPLPFNKLFLVAGLLWWYVGGGAQINDFFSRAYEIPAYIAFFTVSASIWALVALRFKWTLFAFYPWLLMLPLFYLGVAACDQKVFLANYGYVAWPVSISLCFGILWFSERQNYALKGLSILHAASFLLFIAVSAVSVSTEVGRYSLYEYWEALAIVVPVILGLFVINYWKKWPKITQPKVYEITVGLILVAALVLWSVVVNILMFMKVEKLSYIPLLNPMDGIQAIAVIAVFIWCKKFPEKWFSGVNKKAIWGGVAGFCFVWFNAMLFKTISALTGIAYKAEVLFESSLVQMSVSIAWSLIGLATMVLASRMKLRILWVIGAALAGIVVAKLFLLDLSERETVERIISFLVVGLLLLVVGYFSPVPPKPQACEKHNE